MSFSTPMMKQWKSLKDQTKDALLLFRLGDFYEAFFDDANKISKLLDLTLTKRQNIPMCGVPYHAYEVYLDRLIAKGCKVAIAEQTQDPKEAKGIVRREIVRVVSPGTLISSNLLKDKYNNFFLSLCQIGTIFGLAIIDISTSDFYAIEVEDEKDLINEIYKLNPAEILIPRKLKKLNKNLFEKLSYDLKFLLTEKDEWYFDFEIALDKLLSHFKASSLDGFGLRAKNAAITSAGALISYLKDDLSMSLEHIKIIKSQNLSTYMAIDYSTMKNLEILESYNYFNKENTLLNLLDKTSTSMGGRLLKEWLKLPLLDIKKINKRLGAQEEIIKSFEIFLEIQLHLENIKDLQRLLIKIINQSATPRDLATLRSSLQSIAPIRLELSSFSSNLLMEIKEGLKDTSSLLKILDDSLVELPPIRLSDGNIFKTGYNDQLDDLRQISKNSYSWLNNYQNELKIKTNIKTLRVKFNKIFGYFIEVSKAQAQNAPSDFIRKQTLVNTERFITEKLKVFEDKVLNAEDKIKVLENKLFSQLREEILKYIDDIEITAHAVAKLDVLLSFAKAARAYNYVRPEINNSKVIDIKEGRHPIIEASSSTGEFIPNDTYLDNDDNQLFLITGPNMAGKSTYIRQVALIVIMAQIGSYIPCSSGKIGIVDKVFSRIGASDDLSKGQSTFMVEMTETANILNNATNNSLIILDEIGRGTSTYDGISIAWAVAEYLLTQENKKAKTMFATHYFELTQLTKELNGVINYNVAVKETDKSIVFLRKIIKGSTDKSYGIHVAKLANMPYLVIKKAEQRLVNLEKTSTKKRKVQKSNKDVQFLLFDLNDKLNEKIQNLIKEIKDIDIDHLSPIEALQKIYYLKQKIEK